MCLLILIRHGDDGDDGDGDGGTRDRNREKENRIYRTALNSKDDVERSIA